MFKNLSIGQKLSGGFAFVVSLVLGLVCILIFEMSSINAEVRQMVNNQVPSVVSAGRINTLLLDARRHELTTVIELLSNEHADTSASTAAFAKAKDDLLNELNKYSSYPFVSQQEHDLFEKLVADANDYLSYHDQITQAFANHEMEKANGLRESGKAKLNSARQTGIALRDLNVSVVQKSSGLIEDTYSNAKEVGILVGGIVVLAVIIIAWFLTGQVRTPIVHLLKEIELIAQGDLRNKVKLDAFSRDELGKLATGFAAMQENLRNLVGEISLSVEQISSSSEEISAVALQSSGNINKQKHELDQLATAMNEMQATVQEVSRSTNDAAMSAGKASEHAQSGSGVVQQSLNNINQVAEAIGTTADVITKLEEDSRNIGVVLEVIRSIAEQTNLLALNAAIEAARAGDQGRGFAVVADEVRTLARRTQDSTTQINDIIAELQNRTKIAGENIHRSQTLMSSTVDKANEAGLAITEINETVSQISHMNIQIATAAEEQNAVTEELNKNVINISVASEEIADGAKHMAHACRDLSQLSSKLHGVVQRFRV